MSTVCPKKSPHVRIQQQGVSNLHKCVFCNIIFKKKRSRNTKHTFCSRKCYYEWNIGENSYAWGKGEKVCLFCKKVFNPLRETVKKYGGRGKTFCSKSCKMKHKYLINKQSN